MRTRHPFIVLLTLWFALLCVPTPAQQSKPAALAQHVHHTQRHHTAKKAAVSKSVKVWVNTKSGVYHFQGQRWYGNTNQGEYMTEDAARKAGYRATQNGQ